MREFLGKLFEPRPRSESEAPKKFCPGDLVTVMINGAFKDGWVVIRDESSRPKKNDLITVGLPHDPDQDLEGFAFTMQVSRKNLIQWNKKEVE